MSPQTPVGESLLEYPPPPVSLDEEETVELTENDVPGAKLLGSPSGLKVVDLTRWLRCRNLPVKGRKSDLVARYELVYGRHCE